MSTVELLEQAALALGFTTSWQSVAPAPGRSAGRRFELRSPGKTYSLVWPSVGPVYKSMIPGLVDETGVLRSVETRCLRGAAAPPWLPCCLKPDDGSLGEGFVAVERRDEWEAALSRVPSDRPYVVQPLLRGEEFRVTACWDGQYAVARLAGRNGRWSLWADATGELPTAWLRAFVKIVRGLDAPGLGFDVMVSSGEPGVLDVNAAPNLALHLLTGQPRDVARAYLEAWLAKADEGERSRERG